MQSLNLSGETRKSDGYLKSLFWPAVDNAWDVDYLGQQGFWLCFIIAIFSLVMVAITISDLPTPVMRIVIGGIGLIDCFVYLVGGMGVRQSSAPAAIIVFALYILTQLAAGRPPGVLTLIFAAVLLSNVRATILASRWKPATEDEDRPTRFNETFRDKLVDQLPPRVWPILKYPFYLFATAVFLILFASIAQHSVRGTSRLGKDENATPSATVTSSDAQ